MTDAHKNRPEILFLAHRIPYPPDKGDKIRSWRWLQYLSKHFRVHLACFVDDPRDFNHTEFLSDLCETAVFIPLNPKMAKLKSLGALATSKPLSFRYFHDTRMVAAVRAARARPLVAEIAFSSAMAPFIETPLAERKRIIDFCDADSEKWTQYADGAVWPLSYIYAREGRVLQCAETKMVNWADLSFAVTSQEAEIFNRRSGTTRQVGVLPNGVDTDYFNPALAMNDPSSESDVAFVGAMDYRANVEGVLHFSDQVWPKVRADRPRATFTIVGANPVEAINALDGKHGITVTGRVNDVRPRLMGAKIVIAPLRVGRGIQNKVLEAMAMAKPVVASTEAMTGINAPANIARTSSDPGTMAVDILTLLDDAGKREAMGAAARAFVVENFSWETSLAKLGSVLDALGLYSSSSPASSAVAPSSTAATY